MWDWLVRRVRVELALWDCYWWAWDHRDWDSFDYCEEHSWAVRLLGLLILVAANIVFAFALHGFGALLERLRYL